MVPKEDVWLSISQLSGVQWPRPVLYLVAFSSLKDLPVLDGPNSPLFLPWTHLMTFFQPTYVLMVWICRTNVLSSQEKWAWWSDVLLCHIDSQCLLGEPVSVLNSRAPIFDRVSCSRMLAQLLISWGCIAGYALRGIWCRNPSCPSGLFLGIGVAALPW